MTFGQLAWGKRPRTLQIFPVKEIESDGMQDLAILGLQRKAIYVDPTDAYCLSKRL